MNKIAIPALLVATIMVAGAFAFVPVEQASTVHLAGTVTVDLGVSNTAGITDFLVGQTTGDLTDPDTVTVTGADTTNDMALCTIVDPDEDVSILEVSITGANTVTVDLSAATVAGANSILDCVVFSRP